MSVTEANATEPSNVIGFQCPAVSFNETMMV